MHSRASKLLVTLCAVALFAAANTAAVSCGLGTLFIASNNPEGNSIIALHILDDATLSFASETPTGGKGGAGLLASGLLAGPDALASEGSIVLGEGKLFVVNAGSNTVSFFTFKPSAPYELTLVGTADSGGDFPVSLAFNEKRSLLYVVNTGVRNGVRGFKVDVKSGLTVVPDSDRDFGVVQTNPPLGPLNTITQPLFSASGDHLLVDVKGLPATNTTPVIEGYMAAYAIAANGSLAAEPVKTFPNGGLAPFGMTLIPGTQSVFVTDPAQGFTVYNFDAGYDVPAATISTAIPGQVATCWATYSPGTGNFYTTDVGAGVVECSANATAGEVVKIYPFESVLGVIDLAVLHVDSRPDNLYVLAAGNLTIQHYVLLAPGDAALAAPFDIQEAASSVSNKTQGLVVLPY